MFKIKYKRQFMGAPSTKIHFFKGSPNLKALFFDAESQEYNEAFLHDKKGLRGRRLFVTDTNIRALPALKDFFLHIENDGKNNALLVLPPGEESKSIQTVLSIVKAAINLSFTRKDIFVGIGGGVITDMTAFASSIFKRGARCEAVPTTLLAMVDAALGGKSGCDFDDYKNMIGSFMPAERLFVFPDFVQSLPDSEYRSGFAEAFKHALLFDKALYREISQKKEKVSLRESDFVFKMIKASVEAKARVVQKDMTEKNIRMLLNYGHTFGHALETVAGLGKVAHGDAVAWGIGRALALSERLGLSESRYREEATALLKYFGYDTNPVPQILSNTEETKKAIVAAMHLDKKNSSEKVRVILQRGLCKNTITEVLDKDILECL